MNATTSAGPLPLSSTELQTRIDAERRRLLIEQNLHVDLEGQRLAPLEAGDDEALDRVEAQINACNDRQARSQERLEILERRLIEATERERQQDLDAVAARADRARILGEMLIAEYARHAPKLAELIERLAACDQIIEEANGILSRANRDKDMVPSPNAIRCRPRRRWTEIVRKEVGPRDPGHPLFGKQYYQTPASHPVQKVYDANDRTEYDVFVEADVEVEMTDCGDRPDALQDAIVLPAVGPAPDPNTGLLPLWDHDRHTSRRASDAVLAEVMERIEREPNAGDAPAKRKKTTDRGEA
jgi:hypothetical protein